MSKRASGEGSIRQRPNEIWEARITYVDPVTGRRKSHSVYAKTAEAVRDKLDQARDRIKEQAPVRDSSQLVADWLTHWAATSLEALAASFANISSAHPWAPLGWTGCARLISTA